MGEQPEKKFAAGQISATVWNNKGSKDGKEYEFKTVTVVRNYKDKEDKWATTNNFRKSDLPKVQLVTRKAYEYVTLKE